MSDDVASKIAPAIQVEWYPFTGRRWYDRYLCLCIELAYFILHATHALMCLHVHAHACVYMYTHSTCVVLVHILCVRVCTRYYVLVHICVHRYIVPDTSR